MDDCWEDFISLNSIKDVNLHALPSVLNFVGTTSNINPDSFLNPGELDAYVERDTWSLPHTADREGYCGDRHLEYWLLGLRDYVLLKGLVKKYKLKLKTYLDLGCATGRVLRHFAANSKGVQVFGCDINAAHVAWCHKYLPDPIVFQNTSIPYIPMPDSSVDLVTAFSVFTHIEAFESAWLMEIRRILRPGGIAFLSVHSDHTLKMLTPDWPLYEGVRHHPDFQEEIIGQDNEFDRLIYRFRANRSYSSNVFLHSDYIKRVWGQFLTVLEIRREFPQYQDVVILRKE